MKSTVVKFKVLAASVILGGCVHNSTSVPVEQPVVVAERISSPPPFWPPHEYTAPINDPERYWEVHLRILSAQAEEDHWNHTSIEVDPTNDFEIQ